MHHFLAFVCIPQLSFDPVLLCGSKLQSLHQIHLLAFDKLSKCHRHTEQWPLNLELFFPE